MDAITGSTRIGPQIAVGASAAGAVAAFTDMAAGEPAASLGRRLVVTGLDFSAVGACQFAVRATDGTRVTTIYPLSGDLASVGDGQRHVSVRGLSIEVPAGQHFEWITPTAAISRELAVLAFRASP